MIFNFNGQMSHYIFVSWIYVKYGYTILFIVNINECIRSGKRVEVHIKTKVECVFRYVRVLVWKKPSKENSSCVMKICTSSLLIICQVMLMINIPCMAPNNLIMERCI